MTKEAGNPNDERALLTASRLRDLVGRGRFRFLMQGECFFEDGRPFYADRESIAADVAAVDETAIELHDLVNLDSFTANHRAVLPLAAIRSVDTLIQ